MPHPVIIVDYDPRWRILYEAEKRRILSTIGNKVVAIEHIGSTAIPGLGGKPIIDMMGGVCKSTDADECIPLLRDLGYEDVNPQPDRLIERTNPDWYYCLGKRCKVANANLENYHLHLARFMSNHWERHLLFRDFLRSHPDVAQQYYELKKKLAVDFGSDRVGYTDAKTSFIESVVAKAQNFIRGWHSCMERDFSDEKNLIAPCGNFCGSCSLYRCAAMVDTEGQKRLAEWFSKHFPQYHFEPEGMVCIPCRENFDRCWSPDCRVYICCVKEKKLDFCYECDDFPCEELRPYKGCSPAHNLKIFNLLRIKKMGWRQWLEKQKGDTRELHGRY